MRRILLCIATVLLCLPSFAQEDPVVMTVDGYDVTKSEFEYFFDKNNIETNVTKKTVRQYADLYLNFKLKVQAAIDEGMDQTEAFLSEYKMCRDMQAEDYLVDQDFLEHVARFSYESSLAEIGDGGLVHLFAMSIMPDQEAGRSLEDCLELMQSLYDRMNAGESFQSLAEKYSTDEIAARGGEVGWVSVSQLPEGIAETVFSLGEGEVSKPFISGEVAFMVKVEGRRQLGTYEQNRDDIYRWMMQSGSYDEAKRRKANDYAERLGWTIRDDEAVAHLDSVLEEVEPDFRNIAREYYDGLLVFDISNREIWERASNHPEEIENYFESHRKQFKFDKPAFKGVVLLCKSENDYNQLKAILERSDMSDWIDSVLAYNKSEIRVRVIRSSLETGLFRQGQNEYVDNIVFGIGESKPMSSYPYSNWVGRIIKQPDTFEDVAGEVTDEYQKYLENEWLKRLKSKYKYKINKKALKTVGVRR